MAGKKENDDNKKKQKRANGEGSFTQRNGRWLLTITVGRDSNGKTKRKSFTGKTQQEARDKKNEFIAAQKTGTYIEPKNLTIAQWLTTWMELYKRGKIADSSYNTLESCVRVHIIPTIGHVKLQKLKTETIQKMYNEKFNEGAGLKENTIKNINSALREGLEKAVMEDYIIKNPAKGCVLPKDRVISKENVLYEQDLIKIIKALDLKNTYDVLVLLTLSTGIRKGEAIALTWNDIDFDEKCLSINKAVSKVLIRSNSEDKTKDVNRSKYENIVKVPKTRSSIRKIPINENVIHVLKSHKKRIEQMITDEGIKEYTANLVFPSEKGTFLDPHNITRKWNLIQKKAGINERKTFHGLRHSYATFLLLKNTDIKTIQELLGHSSISTTLDVYSHTSAASKKSAASKLNYLFEIKDSKNDEVNDEERPCEGEIKETISVYHIAS